MVKWTVSLIQIPIKGTLIKTNVVMVMVSNTRCGTLQDNNRDLWSGENLK